MDRNLSRVVVYHPEMFEDDKLYAVTYYLVLRESGAYVIDLYWVMFPARGWKYFIEGKYLKFWMRCGKRIKIIWSKDDIERKKGMWYFPFISPE